MNEFERSTVRWAKLAVAMSGLAAVFVCLQWYEMHTGSADTHELAVSAGKQADRTKELADRMKDQADQTKIVADQAKVQAGASKLLAQNSVDTLHNTQKTFRDEQRAWVGVQGTTDSRGFTEAEPWIVTVIFFNSGKTPASDVQSSGMFLTSPFPLSEPTKDQVKQLAFRPAESIAPQGVYRQIIGVDYAGGTISDSQRAGEQTLLSQYNFIKTKHLYLYYFGLLKYNDTFGKSHETQYCIFLANPDTKEVGMCNAFNDLN